MNGYPREFRVAVMMNDATTTKQNHTTRLACSIRGLSSFPAFPNQTLCCEFADPFTPRLCEIDHSFSQLTDCKLVERKRTEDRTTLCTLIKTSIVFCEHWLKRGENTDYFKL